MTNIISFERSAQKLLKAPPKIRLLKKSAPPSTEIKPNNTTMCIKSFCCEGRSFVKKDKIFYSLEEYQLWDNEFGTMPLQLQLSDSNAMMYSMTTRNPLLDYRQIYNINNQTNLKFYKGYNKYLLRNEITNDISREIKWRRDKQPLRWSGSKILFTKYENVVKENVLDSDLLKNFYTKKKLEYICKNNTLKKNKDLFLRLFALSMLGKVYKCEIN